MVTFVVRVLADAIVVVYTVAPDNPALGIERIVILTLVTVRLKRPLPQVCTVLLQQSFC